MASVTVTSENLAEFHANGGKLLEKPEEAPAADPADPVEAKEPEEKPKKRHSIDERLEKMASQKREAQAAAEQARKEAAELKTRLEALEKAQKPGDGKPKAEEFTDAVKYAEALADWRFNEKLKEREATEREARAKSEAERVAAEWQKKVKKFAKEVEDFHEVVDESEIPVSYALRDAILESDIGPKIQYFLVQNPDMVEDFNAMSIPKMLREFGKLEAKLEAAERKEEAKAEAIVPKKRIVEAPEPITPVNGKGSTSTGWQDGGSFQDFKKAYQRGQFK